jgi:hypothetical protein
VNEHLSDLEGIRQAVIKKEHFEAAQVITKSIALIRSTHISSEYLAKENAALKANLRMHLAGQAMSGMIGVSVDKCTKTIAEKSFQMADEMLSIAKKGNDSLL